MRCYECRLEIAGEAKTVTMPARWWFRSVLVTVRLHPTCYRSMLRAMGSTHLAA